MEASIIDLRYKMKNVLKALDRRESVKIFYHGKLKGILLPFVKSKKEKVSKHPFFGMNRGRKRPVQEVMDDLRQGRHAF